MSSLRDIMDDVDTEPLQSQAYRRSKEAAQEQLPPPSDTPSPETTSLSSDKSTGKQPIKRRRSNRVHPIPLPQDSSSDTGVAKGMDYSYSTGQQGGPSQQQGPYRSSEQFSRQSEPALDVPVKYTPITGRVSRAKKGVPVHTCEICRPVKTFTRAEHLRRHQLSHQKPAYPCTFEDCERAFHRPDLLARHIQRHETQGEKAYKAGDPRSRASSSASDSRTPSLKVEGATPIESFTPSRNQASPANAATPGPSDGGGPSMTASNFGGGAMGGNYQAVNFSGSGHLSKRTASQAEFTDTSSYGLSAPSHNRTGPSRTPENYNGIASQTNYGQTQSSFSGSYAESAAPQFNATPQLPLLTIPDERWNPGLTYNNSPWCSSASDTASDASRNGSQWTVRGRSTSVATLADWSQPVWAPNRLNTTPQDIHNPHFDTIPERFDTPYVSPRVVPSPTRGQMFEQASFGGFALDVAYTTPVPNNSFGLVRTKTPVLGPHNNANVFNTAPDFQHPALQANQDLFFSCFWQFFQPLFPIIHRPTFDYARSSLLSYAIAAIGTQYLDSPDFRKKGSELNELCRKGLEICLDWDRNIYTMQTILLTEMFTRFRGRKIIVRPSRIFSAMYAKLLDESKQSTQRPKRISIPVPTFEVSFEDTDPMIPNQFAQNNKESEWHDWRGKETRRRLLAACFIFDIHQSLVLQRPASQATEDAWWCLIYFPSSEKIWDAVSASEWKAQHQENSPALSLVDQSLSQKPYGDTPFEQSLALCWNAARLPSRVDPSYPNLYDLQTPPPQIETLKAYCLGSLTAHSYLAVYHTPLHDLLAVAGDTWVYGKKVTPPSAFHSAQSRLQAWSKTMVAAQATWHACHVIEMALNRPVSSENERPKDLSVYWAIYDSALIIWAFGHRYQASSVPGSNSSSDQEYSPTNTSPDAPAKALAFTGAMLRIKVSEFLSAKAGMRGDTGSVIEAARQLLAVESAGNKCGLLVDAIVVLDKIRGAGKGKWF